jgi:hypothetical protein
MGIPEFHVFPSQVVMQIEVQECMLFCHFINLITTIPPKPISAVERATDALSQAMVDASTSFR